MYSGGLTRGDRSDARDLGLVLALLIDLGGRLTGENRGLCLEVGIGDVVNLDLVLKIVLNAYVFELVLLDRLVDDLWVDA